MKVSIAHDAHQGRITTTLIHVLLFDFERFCLYDKGNATSLLFLRASQKQCSHLSPSTRIKYPLMVVCLLYSNTKVDAHLTLNISRLSIGITSLSVAMVN